MKLTFTFTDLQRQVLDTQNRHVDYVVQKLLEAANKLGHEGKTVRCFSCKIHGNELEYELVVGEGE